MTKTDYKVGDRIYCRYAKNKDQGEVVEVDHDKYGVEVKWDKPLYSKDVSFMDFGEIRLVDPEGDAIRTKAIQAKIDEATSAFEKAFQALQEAGELAGGELYEIKNEDVNLNELHEAITEGGWSTSSLYC